MEEEIKLTQLEIDALSEMGNIGTGNAATSLSKFLNKSIDMNIPETKFVPINKVSNELGGPEKPVSAIYLNISGGLDGEAMFIFSEESAFKMIDLLKQEELGTTKKMTEIDESAFKEMSNIITGSFLTALATMLDVKLIPSVPHVASDMMQSVLDFVLIKLSQHAETVLIIKTKISFDKVNIDGEFLVLFDRPSLKKMIGLLHEKYEHIN